MGKRRNYLLLVIKGCCMGAADVVPGVSGGTIAFITVVYADTHPAARAKNVKMSHLRISLATSKAEAMISPKKKDQISMGWVLSK